MRGSKMTRAVHRRRLWRVTYNGENRPILWENLAAQSNNSSSVALAKEDQTISNQTIKQFFVWDCTESVATRPLVWTRYPDAVEQSGDGSASQIFFYTHDGNKNVSEVIAANCDFAAHYEYAPFGAYASLTVRNWFKDVKNKYKCCCNGKVVGLDEYDGVLDGTMTSWTIAHRVTGCKLKQLGVDLEHVLLLNLGHETMELLGFRPGLESEFISFLNKTSGNLEQVLREYIGDTAKDVLAVLEGYFSDGKDCESKYIPKGCVYRADI